MKKRLLKRQLIELCQVYNWAECEYDKSGTLLRRSQGSDDNWYPVTAEQIRSGLGVKP